MIQKIKTPLIKRMFQRKPKQRKVLKNTKATKKDKNFVIKALPLC